MTGVKNLSAQWIRIFSAGVSLALLLVALNNMAWDVSAQESQESILYPWEGISEPQEPIQYPWDGVSDPQQPISPPPAPAPICHETQDAPYGQCGSDVLSFGRTTDSGGNPIISTHQYEVIRIRNSANVCGALSYTAVDRGEAEVCGARPAPPPTGGPPPTEPPPSPYQSYSACGQSGQLWVGGGYRPLQPSDCTGNTFLKIYRDGSGYITNVCEAVPTGYVRDADGCGASLAPPPAGGSPALPSSPTVSCGRQEIDEGCVDSVRQFRILDTCGGFSSVRRVWDSTCASTMVDGCGESVISSFCSSQSFRTDRVRNTCTGEFTRTVFDTSCRRGGFPFFVGGDGGFDGCFSSFVGSECTSFGIRADVIESNCRGRFQTNFRPDTSCGAAPPVTCDEVFLRTECVDNTGLSVDLFRNSCSGNLVQRNVRRVATCGVPTAAVVVSQPTTQVAGQPVTSVVTKEVKVVTAQAQPQVVLVAGGEIKQLPKTGLPALSYALLGLIPLGWKLRKFGSFNQKLTQDNRYLWEEKQFKRESKD